MRRAIGVLVLTGLACAAATGVSAQGFPDGGPPGALLRHRPGDPGPCVVEVRLQARRGRRADAVTLVVTARNRTRRPVTLALPDDCAGGPVRFQGIRPEYDFRGDCNRGACVRGPGVDRIVLPPRASRELARVTVRPSGDACNAPIAPGRHPISVSLPFQADPVTVCGRFEYELFVPAPARSPRRVQPAPARPAVDPARPHCPRPPPCALHCPHGYDTSPDEHGCPRSCHCAPDPLHPRVR